MSDKKPINAMYGTKMSLNLDKLKETRKENEVVEETSVEEVKEIVDEPVVEEVPCVDVR